MIYDYSGSEVINQNLFLSEWDYYREREAWCIVKLPLSLSPC